ncbi:MAG: acyltransferase [Syntrophaceae bacterium]|nr:acyltransferase [Syntrophaceae bacterium]
MLNFLPKRLVGVIALVLLALNVLFWTSILFVFSFLKLILRRGFDRVLPWLAANWITCNGWWMKLTQKTTWNVDGLDGLNAQGWYLVVSNHQSWADIFVLQKLLNRRIPLMKFFLKRELIWVPFMGLAWWALDFPFLRRHSAEYLKKHPEQRGKDFKTTREACAKFSRVPTSVMNFLEGTRFSKAKHLAQGGPYRHLLKPKAGGIALAMGVLGEKFHSLLNVTIAYPDGAPTFWGFMCGRVRRVMVRVSSVEIPEHLLGGDYEGDKTFQSNFQKWVQELWQEKDAQLDGLLREAESA